MFGDDDDDDDDEQRLKHMITRESREEIVPETRFQGPTSSASVLHTTFNCLQLIISPAGFYSGGDGGGEEALEVGKSQKERGSWGATPTSPDAESLACDGSLNLCHDQITVQLKLLPTLNNNNCSSSLITDDNM